jgi:hypothetical protein
VSNASMSCFLAALIGLLLVGWDASAQPLPKLPKVMPEVLSIPNLEKQPTKIVKPIYPQEVVKGGWKAL